MSATSNSPLNQPGTRSEARRLGPCPTAHGRAASSAQPVKPTGLRRSYAEKVEDWTVPMRAGVLRSACSSGHGAQKTFRESWTPRVEDHTMRYPLIAGLACAALLASVTAIPAQTPAVPGSVPGDAAATPETAAPKPKPKPKRKGPPSSVTVINATANTATGLVITAGEKTTTLSKPLAPKGRATVRLPKLKGCTVSVAATFEGGGRSDAETFDVCKEKSIRFTD